MVFDNNNKKHDVFKFCGDYHVVFALNESVFVLKIVVKLWNYMHLKNASFMSFIVN
jgi:hypothetical protein